MSTPNIDYDNIIKQIRELTSKVGDFQKNFHKKEIDIEKKGKNDLVSFVDKESEKILQEGLYKIFPKADFLGEESAEKPFSEEDFLWVVDPLDGTTNYLYHLPIYATSIALLYKKEVILGCVREHHNEEFFYAIKGKGAYLDTQRLKINTQINFENSLIATGFPYQVNDYIDGQMEILKHCVLNTMGVRRLGAAAVDLAYLACNRFQVYFEYNLKIWDFAAGILLVSEAGGRVTNFDNDTSCLFSKNLLATNHTQHDLMIKLINKNLDSSIWR